MKLRWGPAVVPVIVVAMVVLATTAACGNRQAPGPMMLRAEGVARLQPTSDAPVAQIVAGIVAFGHNLAPASGSENWVASPTSIALALAMARAGANGQTATQIDKTFGFPAAGLHEGFNALSRHAVTAELPPPPDGKKREPGSPPGPTTVCIGNALFPSGTLEISPGYLRTLAEQYGTGVYPVDFHQSTAKDAIDAWARQQTAGRIQKVFDDIDPETALVLANTVYLKGDWATAFTTAATSDAQFRRADGSTVRVPTMHQQAALAYADGSGWQAIELPYGDGAFAMRIIVPTAGASPRDLLAPDAFTAVSAGLAGPQARQLVDVALPRWDFTSTVALREELIRLGVVDAFDPDRADFSALSKTPLFIAKAIHRATITVDENGTEAAAVTALEAIPMSAPPPPTATLHADHPFAFAIVQVATGAPIFIGQVADPSAH